MSTVAPPAKKNKGQSELAKREGRLAFWLLLPTFIILLLIAFYPLGSVFYFSLTDRVFASAEEANFVGLDNYKQLLKSYHTRVAGAH